MYIRTLHPVAQMVSTTIPLFVGSSHHNEDRASAKRELGLSIAAAGTLASVSMRPL